MNALLKELLQMPEARALLDSTLRRDKPMVTGVSPVHRAMLAAAMLPGDGPAPCAAVRRRNGGRAAVRRPPRPDGAGCDAAAAA